MESERETNQLCIRTEKGEYVGSDMVYGSVYLRIQREVSGASLKLVVRGYQICKYDYTYMVQEKEGEFASKSGQRATKKDIVKHELTLLGEGMFEVGCYAYPFKYQLPHNLPGSFDVHHEDVMSGSTWEGVVGYTLSAVLIEEGAPRNRVSVESPLVVYDSLDCRNDHYPSDIKSATGTVKTFFCISRGSINVSSRLKKSAYAPSDSITLSVDIKNDSSVDVPGFTVNVLRVIKLEGLDRSRGEEVMTPHTILHIVLEQEGEGGCAHNSTSKHEVVLDLSKAQSSFGIPPNTSGSIVKCHYVTDVNVHLPWAPDVEVRQSLLITAPDNELWRLWTPPSWIDQCRRAQTNGSAAVSDEILASQSFTGIPVFRPNL